MYSMNTNPLAVVLIQKAMTNTRHRHHFIYRADCIGSFLLWVYFKLKSPSNYFIDNFLLFGCSSAKIYSRCFYAFVTH